MQHLGPHPGRRAPRRRGDSGAAALEFALVMPILLMLLLGIIQYGLYFWAMQGGADIAREAARRAAVSDPPDCSDFVGDVRADVDDLVGSGSTAVVTRTYDDADPQVGDDVRVSVEFDSYDLDIPILPMPADGRVGQSAEARVEYVPSDEAAPETCP